MSELTSQMTLESWMPFSRPPTLELPMKDDANSFVTSDIAAVSAGTLSPDIRLTAPSLFRNSDSTPESSVLKVGDYLLTKRLADMSNGIAQYNAVHIDTSVEYVCRVLPLDRYYSMLAPYTVLGKHKNIDEVKEIIVGSTCAYAMHDMLLTCGEDLHSYVRRRRRLTEPEAVRLFLQVLQAVVHCHRHGVVIRDIKLRRFFFADDDKVRLKLDGLYDAAVFDGSNDLLNDKHGCLAYVSPEIIDATFCAGSSTTYSTSSGSSCGSYSGRSADMWSLGVMLYTMLIGRYPFADTDACTLFNRIRRGRYSMPADVTLSPTARCLLRSLLTVKPEDRLTAEEAINHPWIQSIECGQSTKLTQLIMIQDDSVVPQSNMEIDEDFYSD